MKLDAPLHGDILTPWPAVEEGARHNGDKELKQEVGGDAAGKKREEALFSSTQHLSTSTTTAHSSLSQGTTTSLQRFFPQSIITKH